MIWNITESYHLLRQNEWVLLLEKAIKDKSIVLTNWNDFFGREYSINFSYDTDIHKNQELHQLAPAFQYMVENQQILLDKTLTKFLPIYESWRDLDFGLEDKKDILMPSVTDIKQFIPLLDPITIMILPDLKGGVNYIHYEFDTVWSDEGLGVIMCKDEIMAIGTGACDQ